MRSELIPREQIVPEEVKAHLLRELSQGNFRGIETFVKVYDVPQSVIEDPEVQAAADEWISVRLPKNLTEEDPLIPHRPCSRI